MKRLKRVGRFVLIALGAFVVLFAALLAALKLFEPRVAPPGQMIEANGTRMRIECTGPTDTGLPTVILESGATGLDAHYYWLQQSLAQQVRVCNYDRVGTAWSEDRDEPHDSVHFAPQLHALLQKAGVKPPYVLAGHSLGGPIIRVFAKAYPAEVSGLVFLDSSHPDQLSRIPALADPKFQEKATMVLKLLQASATTGFSHIVNLAAAGLKGPWFEALPQERQKQLLSLTHRPQTFRGMREEADSVPNSFQQGGVAKSFGDMPLLVISARDMPSIPGFSDQWRDELKTGFDKLQEELATLSSRGQRIVLPGNHMSMVIDKDNSRDVAAAILGVVREAASYTPPR